MAAGGGERHRRHLHPWAVDIPTLDGVPEGDIHELGRPDVAHRRKPGVERPLRVRRRGDRDIDRRAAE